MVTQLCGRGDVRHALFVGACIAAGTLLGPLCFALWAATGGPAISTLVALQCVAVALTLSGTWVTGNKHVAGPALSAVAAAVFVALNIVAGLWIVAGLSALSVAINVRNAMKWGRARNAAI